MAERRLARVFVWKEGTDPDPEYVQQVLQVAVPQAREAPPVPITSEAVQGDWPDDFWGYALPRMRADGNWTDPARYELSGWTGSDSRSNSRLFVASVYERPQPVALSEAPPTIAPPEAALPPPPPGGIGYGAPPSGFPVGATNAGPAAPTPAPADYSVYAPGPSGAQPEYIGYPPAPAPPPAAYPTYPPAPTAPTTGYGAPPAPAPYAQPAYGTPPAPPAPLPPAYGPYPGGGAPAAPSPTAWPTAPPAYIPPPDAYPHQTGISAADLINPYQGFYVGFGPRLVAGIVDLVLVGFLELMLVLIAVLIGRQFNSADAGAIQALLACGTVVLALVVLVIYLADFWAWRGQTPGMIMMGIRVVTENGTKPGLGRALLRALGYVMSILTLGIGFLLLIGDERKQGLQDRVAGTFVVPAQPPPGARPADLPGYATEASPAPAGTAMPAAPPPTNAGVPAAPPAQSDERAWTPPAAGAPAPAAAELAAVLPSAEPAPADSEAAAQFRRGLALLAEGVREPGGGRTLMIVEPEAGQAATVALQAAATAAPTSALYRHFVGVARRYGEGYEAALPEFERARQLDPGLWEAQMQVFFGPRWHDAFAYPAWAGRETTLPGVLRALLPGRPGSRLVLVRESAGRTVAVLIQTQRSSWKRLPTADMPARVEVHPSQTPTGLIIALYVALRDDPQNPYRGETFVNPAEVPGEADDATALGQNLVIQLARQTYTYLIFVDETGAVLLNRRLVFDPATRQALAQAARLAQAAAYQAIEYRQPMTLAAFQEPARWHIQQLPLERVQV